jgi:hypothetical protein
MSDIVIYSTLSLLAITLALLLIWVQLRQVNTYRQLQQAQLELAYLKDKDQARQKLSGLAKHIEEQATQAYQVGWTEELAWMIHDETWTPTLGEERYARP